MLIPLGRPPFPSLIIDRARGGFGRARSTAARLLRHERLVPLRRVGARVRAFVGEQRMGLVVTAATLVVYLAAFLANGDRNPGSDGFYNWLYARSLAFDHDVNFRNDYSLCGDPQGHNLDRIPGHPDNPFYVGPSLFWVPAILVVRLFVRFSPTATAAIKAGCSGPIPGAVMHVGPFVGALVVYLSYRAARRVASEGVAAVAAGLFAFGSTLGPYSFVWHHYAHVYEAACMAALVVASLRASEEPGRLRRWVLVGLCLATCALQRLPDAMAGLIPLTLAVVRLRHDRRKLLAATATFTLLSIALGLVPQLLVYRYLYGKLFAIPQGRHYLQWGHAHPWLLVFAPKGLLYMAPVAWLSGVGALLALRRRPERPFLVGLVVVCAVLTYVASTPLDWYGWSGLGARRLIVLTPLFVVLAARALTPVITWLLASEARGQVSLAAAVFVPFAFVFVGSGLGVGYKTTDIDGGRPQADTYGTGATASWKWVDKQIGAVAVLPFEAWFRWRYDLSHQGFYDALNMGHFEREYATLKVKHNHLAVDDNARPVTTGLAHDDHGLVMTRRRASIVFTPQWPYATRIEVKGRALRPTRVRVGSGRTLREPLWFGEIDLGPKESAVALPVPPGGYDSGVNEFVFEAITPDDKPVIAGIDFFDDRAYPPPF